MVSVVQLEAAGGPSSRGPEAALEVVQAANSFECKANGSGCSLHVCVRKRHMMRCMREAAGDCSFTSPNPLQASCFEATPPEQGVEKRATFEEKDRFKQSQERCIKM